MAQINIKVDDEVKASSEKLFKGLGLTMSAAITLFLHQSVIQHGLPFQVKEAGYVSHGVDSNREAVYALLREASQYARAHQERMTHRQVFDGLQEIIDGARVSA